MKKIKTYLLTIIASFMLVMSSCTQGQGDGHMMNGHSLGWGMGGGYWVSLFVIVVIVVVVIVVLNFFKGKRQR